MGSALREKLGGGGLLHVMAAHSPLSARLVEEACFDGIWASGFEALLRRSTAFPTSA